MPSTPLGVGAARQVHALAIDPQDSTVFYLGTDVAGVWRSTDGGTSWHPWSDGLANPNQGRSFYVDDLLVLEDTVLAATQGGIYRRVRGGSWELQTPPDHYSYKFTTASDERKNGAPIPFSTLARDDSTGALLAGAGTARAKSGWVFYPDLEPVDPTVQDKVTVMDDTHPECVDLVATPYMEPGGTVMWVIDWTTRNLSIGDQDRVSILQPDGMEYVAYVGYPRCPIAVSWGARGARSMSSSSRAVLVFPATIW